jgi:hypothetical protein
MKDTLVVFLVVFDGFECGRCTICQSTLELKELLQQRTIRENLLHALRILQWTLVSDDQERDGTEK